MDLTEEEKNIFGLDDNDLTELPSYHIERGLMQSYSKNDEIVQITFGYIKRILFEVAKKRGLDISRDISFDTDELLKSIIEVPEELTDFDPNLFKSFNDLNDYVQSKINKMNSTEMEEFFRYFDGFNGIGGINDSFRKFMALYIQKLYANIDALNYEIDSMTLDDDEWGRDEEESQEESEMAEIKEVSDEESEGFTEWDFTEGSSDNSQDSKKEEKVTDEELIGYIKFLNTYPLLMEYKENGFRIANELIELVQKTKLNEFYSNQDFYEDFKKIMAHDSKKHVYRFHGTQDLESADTIISEGLGMMRKDLATTTYPEFTMDQVILYSRGFGREIGRDAIVIIDEPIEESGKRKSIVDPLPKGKKIHFVPSGLQGLNGKPKYIVNPQYIVGYVDKKNKQIVFNARYYDYDRFGLKSDNKRPKDVPFSNERIAEGIARFDQSELEIPDNQLES